MPSSSRPLLLALGLALLAGATWTGLVAGGPAGALSASQFALRHRAR